AEFPLGLKRPGPVASHTQLTERRLVKIEKEARARLPGAGKRDLSRVCTGIVVVDALEYDRRLCRLRRFRFAWPFGYDRSRRLGRGRLRLSRRSGLGRLLRMNRLRLRRQILRLRLGDRS